jgi:hypothetical protein
MIDIIAFLLYKNDTPERRCNVLLTLLVAFFGGIALHRRWNKRLRLYPWLSFWDIRLTIAILFSLLIWQGVSIMEHPSLDTEISWWLGRLELLAGLVLSAYWLFAWVVGKVNEIFDPIPLPPEGWKGKVPSETE